MFRHWPIFLSCAVIIAAYAAYYTLPHNAEEHTSAPTVRLTKASLQSGIFRLPDCPTATDMLFDECVCESSLEYPVVEGLPNKQAADKLNAYFISLTEPFRCEGEPIANPGTELPKDGTHHTLITSFDTTYEAPDYAGIRFSTYIFSGGAHGLPGVSAYIVDYASGDFLKVDDVLDEHARSLANQLIYDELKRLPEGMVFTDVVEKNKGRFLQEEGCETCTMGVTPSGLEVVFGVYGIAPYASGNIVVPLPADLITHAGLRESLRRTAGSAIDNASPPAP